MQNSFKQLIEHTKIDFLVAFILLVCTVCMLLLGTLVFVKPAYAYVNVPPSERYLDESSERLDDSDLSLEEEDELEEDELFPEEEDIGTTEHIEENQVTLKSTYNLDNASSVQIASLASANTDLDGKLVKFQGEAIGDVVRADKGNNWILIDEDGNALSVLMSDAQVELISNFGKYGILGSTLEIIGVYTINNQAYDGEMTVHAIQVTVLDEGGPVKENIPIGKFFLGIGFFVLSGIMLGLYQYLRRRSI